MIRHRLPIRRPRLRRRRGLRKQSETPSRSRPRPLQPQSARKEEPAADSKGSLVLFSTPSGAQVFIDGRNTGRKTPVSPRNPIRLSPGPHRVTFVNSAGRFFVLGAD